MEGDSGFAEKRLMCFVDSEGQDAKNARTSPLVGSFAEQLCPRVPLKGKVRRVTCGLRRGREEERKEAPVLRMLGCEECEKCACG